MKRIGLPLGQIVTAIFLSAGPWSVIAAPASTNLIGLAAAIDSALQNNPDLRALAAHVDAAAGRAYQAKQWTNPELELAADDWPVTGGHGFSDAKQTIGVAQTFPYPGKKKLDREIGGAGVRLSEAELEGRRILLVQEVKSAFFQALAAQRLVEVAGELVKVTESVAKTARKRVEAGDTALQEQLRAEIQWEQAKTEEAGFLREVAVTRQNLATLMGRSDLVEISLAGTLTESVDLGVLEQKPADWLALNPGVVAAMRNRERVTLEEKRSRLEPYPDVKLGLAGGRIGGSDESIVELRFSLPLPIIDRAKGKQREARANIAAAEAELAGAEQRLVRAWNTASKRLRTAAEQVANYRERILPKAEEALRLVQRGFEEGKFGFIDLLDTQRTTAEARLAYQNKLLELNLAQAEIEALLARAPNNSPRGKKP